MTSEQTALRHVWMVEVARWIVLHADPLHDPTRRYVARHCKGDDLRQVKWAKPVGERRPGRFRGVAAASVLPREAPARLDGPEAKAIRCDMVLEPGSLGVTFLAGQGARKPSANFGVGI